MGVHVSNGQIRTSTKGIVINAFKFLVGAAGAVGVISQGRGNFITSIIRTAAGQYTIQLNKNYPVNMLNCFVEVHPPLVTSAVRRANYKAGSYSPVTGAFDIFMADNTPAAAEVVSGSEVHVEIKYADMKTGVAD